jgi:molecular chaperone DnaK (HSP70)
VQASTLQIMAEIILGIDLGATNSLVAICNQAGARVLAPEGESPIVPSAVRYEETAADPWVE